MTHGDSANRPDDEPDQPLAETWNEAALLCAVASGASLAEIACALDGDEPPSEGEVRRALADLTRSGLLAPAAEPGGRAMPTEAGRRLILEQLGRWRDAARAVAEEREQVEQLRTDLLSTISHELRTPLTLIRTSIGLLLDSEPDDEMRQRLLRNIQQSTERMHLLVADLLDLARLRGERFELQVRDVDSGELVAGAVTLLRPLFDGKQQRVEMTLPAPAPVVPGDYRRLERVLINLLGNAHKFAQPGSRVTVTVSEGAREVTFVVQDSGPGIPAAALPHLFEQFFTARTSSTRHNIGAGLGLPIAKGIVEAHGGRIWVESTVGTGTAVSFTVPRSGLQEGSDEGAGDR